MQKEYVGLGSLDRLREVLEKEKPSSIYLVTGKTSYPYSGAQQILESLLSTYKITSFSDFSINPQLEDIKKGISLFRQNDNDLVIALGGGSVIDMAKSINFLTASLTTNSGYCFEKPSSNLLANINSVFIYGLVSF